MTNRRIIILYTLFIFVLLNPLLSIQGSTGLNSTDFWIDLNTSSSVLLIDVRPVSLYEDKHMPSAINIPWSNELNASTISLISAFGTDLIMIYCSCEEGSNAQATATLLEGDGFDNIIYMIDNFRYWPYDTVSGPNPGVLLPFTSDMMSSSNTTNPGNLPDFLIVNIFLFGGIFLLVVLKKK